MEMVTTTITITEKQREWLDRKFISLTKYLRGKLDEDMQKNP